MMVDDTLIADLTLARETLENEECSIVVVKNKKVLLFKKGHGLKPIFETFEEIGPEIKDSVVADRILGKASAFLFRYAGVKSVYTPQATKGAVAVLIVGGIPSQVEKLIPFIKNNTGDNKCPFEKILEGVESPKKAFELLKTRIK